MKTDYWNRADNRSTEDEYLFSYGESAGGVIYAEVPTGRVGEGRPWSVGSKTRRIDGVRLIPPNGIEMPDELKTFGADWEDEFNSMIRTATVEVVEVKRKLNRLVIGQVIVGAEMLEVEYGISSPLKTIVYQVGDPAQELICLRLGIQLYRVNDYTS